MSIILYIQWLSFMSSIYHSVYQVAITHAQCLSFCLSSGYDSCLVSVILSIQWLSSMSSVYHSFHLVAIIHIQCLAFCLSSSYHPCPVSIFHVQCLWFISNVCHYYPTVVICVLWYSSMSSGFASLQPNSVQKHKFDFIVKSQTLIFWQWQLNRNLLWSATEECVNWHIQAYTNYRIQTLWSSDKIYIQLLSWSSKM